MLVKCKECKKEHSSKASKCPHCGYKSHSGCLVILLVIFIGITIISISGQKPSKREPEKTTQQPLKPIEEPPAAKIEQPVKSKWRTSSETSQIDDSTNQFAIIDAELPVTGWPNTVTTPTLIIRCKENATDVMINTGLRPQSPSGDYDAAYVTIRIDDQKAKKIRTNESTDGKALFFPEPVQFLKSLIGHKKLLFEFTPFNSSPTMTHFDISEIAQNITGIQKSCNWQ